MNQLKMGGPDMENMYSEKEIRQLTESLLVKSGLADDDAYIFADVLIQANLEGVDSHGINKLPTYVKRFMDGRFNAKPNITSERTASGIVLIDGDNGPGPVVSMRAINAALETVTETGITAVGVKNSNHFGAASYYCQQACAKQMICITLSNSAGVMAPWGAKEPYFGTNPIAFGFPTGTETPVIIDMATSTIARSKVRLAAINGQPIPKDWAIDAEGNFTTDAEAALGGSVLPMAGPKGSGLALAIEILSGLVTGAAFGKDVKSFNDDTYAISNVGHFFILIDIQKIMNWHLYEQLMHKMITEIKDLPKAAGVEEIFIPGERRAREVKSRQEKGIYISPSVLKNLKQAADDMGVPFLNK